MSRAPKARVTITLSRDLLRQIDRAAEREEGGSRSAFIEQCLRQAMHRASEATIARETVAYYRSLSEEERMEDEALSQALGSASRRALAGAAPEPRKRRRKR